MSITFMSVVFWVTVGLLVARGIGLVLDGTDPRQWQWVAVEGVVAAAAGTYLWMKLWRHGER